MEPIVSDYCRIRYPEIFSVKNNSIVDDYCYFAVKVQIGEHCHIASGCSIAGGKDKTFTLGNFSGISSGVKIWCESNDYVNDLITLKPEGIEIGDKPFKGDVKIGDMCGIGANTIIMPGNSIPEGVAIGALSYVPPGFEFKSWCVYAGNPIQLVLPRNKENVLEQAENLKRETDG